MFVIVDWEKYFKISQGRKSDCNGEDLRRTLSWRTIVLRVDL